MKLLASLVGCAVADYACCPYDDFGIVNPDCPLSEKTPWAMMNSNANFDPAGVTDHMCKSWEANIDATMEGNEDGDNWGGCGFQRHFPWGIDNAFGGKTTPGNPASVEHCRMGVFDCTGTTMTNLYVGLELGTGGTIFPLGTGGFSAGHTNDVFGQVTLGGVCKLWIPVRQHEIDSVTIAGVHMNGGGMAGGAGSMAVFDNASVCNTIACNTIAKQAGTAYCFSVVNVAEFMENNMPGSTFRVMNANVAGSDVGGGDPIKLEGNAFMQDFPVDFGSSIEPTNAGAGTGTMVDVGASFDVVVHFKSAWCIRHWTIFDMQADPDVGSLVEDYPLEDDGTGNPRHAHTDVADKRFSGRVGLCGCCSGTTGALVRHDNPSHTTITAESCTPCADNTLCTEFNSYAPVVPATMMWPNAGAWAAYYSFITCSDNQFMIYDTLAATPIVSGEIATTTNDRVVVHSMFYNDVRHDYSNAFDGTGTVAIRGNFRQVGETMTNCGPGVINTVDSKRCTWNWNFKKNTGVDQEEWFNRASPQSFAVWKAGAAVQRGNEADAHAAMITNIVETHAFTAIFKTDSDLGTDTATPVRTHVFTLDAAKYFSTPALTVSVAAGNQWDFTMHCLESSLDGGGLEIQIVTGTNVITSDTGNTVNIRDVFPDCYMGDEIHFQYHITGGATATMDHRISAWYSTITATFA